MYTKIFGNTTGIRGTHHTPGSNYVYYVQQGSTNGIVARVRITPLELVSSGTSEATLGTQINLDTGIADLVWEAGAAGKGLRALAGTTKLYKYAAAPVGGLANIDPTTLTTLTYNELRFTEDGLGNNYYAVRLSAGNFAVVRVYLDSTTSPAKTRIEWLTYKLNFNPQPWAAFNCLNPRDIVLSPDELTAYISGDDHVYRVANNGTAANPDFNANFSTWTIDTQPLNQPQQLALYNQMVYVVASDSLWVIDPASNTQQIVVSGLGTGVGLLVDPAQGVAYLSNQAGELYSVDLDDPAPALRQLPNTVSPLPGAGGFLTWADSTRVAFYITVRSPVNQVIRVDLNTLTRTTLLDTANTPADPWSTEVVSGNRVFLASNGEVGDISLGITSTDLVMGIGLVPFQYINNLSMNPPPAAEDIGKADTTRAPGYFFQVHNAPFGGSLTLIINHRQAKTAGIEFYRVSLIGPNNTSRDITNGFTDLKWLPVGGVPRWEPTTTSSTGAAGTPANAFPVRGLNDLWYNPYTGAIISTSATDNGLNTLRVEFFDEDGVLLPVHTANKQILIDNDATGGSLLLPRIGTASVAPVAGEYPELDCGCIRYTSKDDLFEVDFSAWHPRGTGRYSLAFYRGGAHLPALYEEGLVNSQNLRTKSSTSQAGNPPMRLGHLLGDCNVANVSIRLSVPAYVIDGYRWVNLGTSLSRSFTFVPNSFNMNTPWP
jgi:hypothetical protein